MTDAESLPSGGEYAMASGDVLSLASSASRSWRWTSSSSRASRVRPSRPPDLSAL